LRLERVDHWERIASRRRPAFSSHLISRITGHLVLGRFHLFGFGDKCQISSRFWALKQALSILVCGLHSI
jgi:hypothetical protein